MDQWRVRRRQQAERELASADDSTYQYILAQYHRDVEKMSMIGGIQPPPLFPQNTGGALGPTGGGNQGAVSAAPGQKAGPLPLKHHSPEALAMMIATRMRYATPKAMPFEHLHVHAVSESKVIVLVVNGEQHAVLEDDGQFPSDTLINQLRLMID